MKVNVRVNVKLTLDGTTYRFKAGVQDVPKAVGELLVRGELADAVSVSLPEQQPIQQEQSKPKRGRKKAEDSERV